MKVRWYVTAVVVGMGLTVIGVKLATPKVQVWQVVEPRFVYPEEHGQTWFTDADLNLYVVDAARGADLVRSHRPLRARWTTDKTGLRSIVAVRPETR